jgi:hypothetical protein
MKPMIAGVFLVVFLGAFAISQPAWAYLDPVSGSMILQLVLGGLAGMLVVLKLYWRRFMNVVFGRRGFSKQNETLN